jgi:hypothetical protein
MLVAARDAGELTATADPVRLSRLIEAVIVGGLMSWAFRPTGSASARVRALLSDALAPHRTGPRKARSEGGR